MSKSIDSLADLDEVFTASGQSEPYLDAQPFIDKLQPELNAADWPPTWLKRFIIWNGFILGLGLAILIFPIGEAYQYTYSLLINFEPKISLFSIFLASTSMTAISLLMALHID